MTDIVDQQTRSRMMAGIRGKDTKPELALRRALHARGFRFRLHSKVIDGRPDLVLSKYRAIVFVHGCFWHRHEGCRYTTTPSTRQEFWQAKFAANVTRDKAVREKLLEEGARALLMATRLKSGASVSACTVSMRPKAASLVSMHRIERGVVVRNLPWHLLTRSGVLSSFAASAIPTATGG